MVYIVIILLPLQFIILVNIITKKITTTAKTTNHQQTVDGDNKYDGYNNGNNDYGNNLNDDNDG